MRFTMDAWEGLADGSITVTFRRWKRCQVIVGNHYRSPAGMLAVTSVTELAEPVKISMADANRSGAPTAEAIVDRLGPPKDETLVYRVEFHNAGPDPRTELQQEIPTETELAEIVTKLDRLDKRSTFGPWTSATLQVISDQPGTRAPDLAEGFGRETKPFKLDVRKLKALGLTQSLKVGYQLSPRGQAVLQALTAVDDLIGSG